MAQEKHLYVLTGLMHPVKYNESDSSVDLIDNKQEMIINTCRVTLRGVFILENEVANSACINFSKNPRYLMKIDDGIRDDDLAQRFADAVMLALAIAREMILDNGPLAIAVQEPLYKDKAIKIEDLLCSRGMDSEEYFALSEGVGIPGEMLNYIWRIAPVMIENKYLIDAASFYAESIKSVWLADEDISELEADNDDYPLSPFAKSSIETAYQNAFKAIEAIIGEPPSDVRKLINKLEQAGINPKKIVGYRSYDRDPEKDKLINKLIDMQKNRDKKAAHGKTLKTGRDIGFRELKDKQMLSRHIILTNIKFKLDN